MVPNLNIAQAIQGAIPGVMIQTTEAGASPDEVIMVRGRNSIKASNDPLIVVDGISYEGNIRDINRALSHAFFKGFKLFKQIPYRKQVPKP